MCDRWISSEESTPGNSVLSEQKAAPLEVFIVSAVNVKLSPVHERLQDCWPDSENVGRENKASGFNVANYNGVFRAQKPFRHTLPYNVMNYVSPTRSFLN
jgi:hypothetical protein